MSNPAPITLEQLFRYYRGLPHQAAAIVELEADIKTTGYAVAMRRDRPWFQTWSTAGRQPDPVELALPLIKEFEGCRLQSYPDPLTGGKPWTIGWGTTVYPDGRPVAPNQKVSQERADELLEQRVRGDCCHLSGRVPAWAKMSANQQAAMLSFTYNVGPNWYEGSGFATITRRIKEQDWALVPDALMLYVNPGTNVEEGLRRRRKAEGDLWRGGESCSKPKLSVEAQQVQPPMLKLTKTNQRTAEGLVLLQLQRFKDSVPMDTMMVVSGAPGRQQFRKGPDSKAGSLEPLPQGRWYIEDIAWAGGKDNYDASWGEALGPASVPLRYLGPGATGRSAIEIHYDANRSYSPGTAGCLGLLSLDDLRKLVGWLRADDPRLLLVDWGLQ